jgi:CO/xanthine dehydrogenase FAD-binding subunit
MSPSVFEVFHAPASLGEALALLAVPGARALAGGTDLVARLHSGAIRERGGSLVSLHRLDTLRDVSLDGGDLVIGALTTVTTLRRRVREHLPALAEAADRFAGPQIRNTATIGGNLCNASPAADLAPPLLAADARLVLEGAGGRREVDLAEWFTGPGRTVLEPGELLVAVRVPIAPARAAFEKAGTRPSLDISVVAVAVAVVVDGGRVRRARVALGAVAPTPIRSPAAEALLEGAVPTPELADAVALAAAEDSRPLSDVRASDAYRRHLVRVHTRRAIRRVLDL